MSARKFTAVLLTLLLLASTVAAEQDVSRQPARTTPQWAREGVIYEIYERNFSQEGTLNAITARLDDLKSLGVNILWLMPIHPIGQLRKKGTIGSPYAVRDYYEVNPDYGTKEDLRKLVSEAHRRKMKVIIDIVANHTSWDSVLMRDPNFYKRDAQGHILPPAADWAGPDVDVAQLNFDNPRVRDYLIEMMKYWLREFDLDGFRCDVAGMIPLDFWERARDELERIKPDIFMLGETCCAPDWLLKAFDAYYDWPLFHKMEDVVWGTTPARGLREVWEDAHAHLPRNALQMRFTDDHDEQRAVSQLGRRAALAASAFMFTVDGIPLLYNGMEVGDSTESGDPALFERMPVFWKIARRRPEYPRFYKQIIALRRAHAALQQGETEWVRNSDDARVVTYLRRSADEEFLIAINLSNQPFTGVVEAGSAAGAFTEVTPDIAEPLKPNATERERAARRRQIALPALTLDAWGLRIFRRALR